MDDGSMPSENDQEVSDMDDANMYGSVEEEAMSMLK